MKLLMNLFTEIAPRTTEKYCSSIAPLRLRIASTMAFIAPVLPHARLGRGQTRAHTCTAPQPAPIVAEVDRHFAQLNHVNKNLRVRASAALGEIGGDACVARLVSLLDVEDTDHRRAAVQALGMIGVPCVDAVLECMIAAESSVVRASCAKALAAVALYFPEERAGFDERVLAALQSFLSSGTDPVTKIATVGCLGTLACDVKEGVRGSVRAGDILMEVLECGQDVAIGAVAVGAVAQIGHNADEERRAEIVRRLKALVAMGGNGEEDGFNYVSEMARSHIEQLEGGTKAPEDND